MEPFASCKETLFMTRKINFYCLLLFCLLHLLLTTKLHELTFFIALSNYVLRDFYFLLMHFFPRNFFSLYHTTGRFLLFFISFLYRWFTLILQHFTFIFRCQSRGNLFHDTDQFDVNNFCFFYPKKTFFYSPKSW